MPQVFLTAEWRKLVNLTYAVDPECLREYVPAGTELDVIKGRAHVSWVAFDFLNTRVMGVRIPGHVNFPELNLRFYVRFRGEPGVVFIREYVPRRMIAYVARALYNEPYVRTHMESACSETANTLEVRHTLRRGGRSHSLELTAEKKPWTPGKDTTEHYFKEHDLGFGRNHFGKTLVYRVEHPVWEIYPVRSYRLDFDFGTFYGEKWRFLNDLEPTLALLAEGSAIAVYRSERLNEFA